MCAPLNSVSCAQLAHQNDDEKAEGSPVAAPLMGALCAAGEPELAVAPAAMQAPVHVYQPGGRGQPPRLLTEYGTEQPGPPVRVLFYGAHYDALVVAAPAQSKL